MALIPSNDNYESELDDEYGWQLEERELQGYELLQNDIITCPNCDTELVQIIKVKQSTKEQTITVICPKCEQESYKYKVDGEIYLGPIAGVVSDYDTCEMGPNKFRTVIRM